MTIKSIVIKPFDIKFEFGTESGAMIMFISMLQYGLTLFLGASFITSTMDISVWGEVEKVWMVVFVLVASAITTGVKLENNK